jgi:hypothetical protein
LGSSTTWSYCWECLKGLVTSPFESDYKWDQPSTHTPHIGHFVNGLDKMQS